MRRILFLPIFIFLLCVVAPSEACTTFLVSGKYTPDGRPLLYKHRDTGDPNNALKKFTDGKYLYIGLINATPNGSNEVWGGYNETGFAIINSAAYTNNVGDTTKLMDQEGVLMKKALQCCATLRDFENLLDTLPKPLGIDANFGVIDALGGAAYYEAGNYKYVKADANNPLQAPDGFLVRSNHSFSGKLDKGYGFIRYQTAYAVLAEAAAAKQFSPEYLLNHISRNLTHALTGKNMEDHLPASAENSDYRFFIDYIPRNSSASAVLIAGCPRGGSPSQTMMWSLIGFPLTTVAVPVWLDNKLELPQIVSIGNNGHAWMCDAALRLKKECFPIERGSGKKYINFSIVENRQGTGVLQKIRKVEKLVFQKALPLWKGNKKLNVEAIRAYNEWLEHYIMHFYDDVK